MAASLTLGALFPPGSCQVEVRIRDENDVSPRWSKEEWMVEVEEGGGPGTLLATLTIRDPDTSNEVTYRVSSGPF